jgi:hypothetical protein
MKTIQLNKFAGKIEIPDAYEIVREGLTQKGDQACPDFNFRFFNVVGVGGVPISRYTVVIRPTRGARKWSKTRTFTKPKKTKKGKK